MIRGAGRVRYSQWDGSQEIAGLDADELLGELSDDLMYYGDLQQALRNFLQRGMPGTQGGIHDLIQRLREARRQQLERYNLSGIMDDIRARLDEVERLERDSIAAMRGSRGDDGPRANDGSAAGDSAGQADDGRDTPESGSDESPPGDRGDDFARNLMGDIAGTNERFLDGLPEDTPGRVRALQDYEFLSPDAQRKFEELLDELKRAVTQTFFKDVEKMINEMSEGDIERMKAMVDALNEMLVRKIAGEDPGFDEFMQRFGDMFGDDRPRSLDELIERMQEQMAAMQSLMMSMPTGQFEQLQQLLRDRLGDPKLDSALRQLAQKLEFLDPRDPSRYRFRGNEHIDLDAAMRLMRELQDMDEVQRQLERTRYNGDIDSIDLDKLRELLGEDAVKAVEQMQQLTEILEKAGYIRKDGQDWELTPRGTRVIAQKALGEIYRQLRRQRLGRHQSPEEGRFGDRIEDTKAYEFGEPLHLNLPRTVKNALYRQGPGTPVSLVPEDFEVYRSEMLTQTSTVMLLDLSWSMALRGSFMAAKKVAMALNNLITSQYPRDSFYVVGFSAYARELKARDLPFVQCDEYMLGTNMQHALMIAEQLLAKHPEGARQVLMITDGEPTSHLENGRAQFSYPPSPITIAETLSAVQRCTRRGIAINTFMLEESYYLKEFVDQMTRINGGRVFYTTPDRLGEYILVDYVQHKRKRLAGRRG